MSQFIFYVFILVVVAGCLSAVVAVGLLLLAKTNRSGLLWMLALITRREFAMREEVEYLAGSVTGRDRLRLARLLGHLHRGFSLGESLQRTPGVVPRDAAVLAQVAEAQSSGLAQIFTYESKRLGEIRRAAVSMSFSPALLSIYLLMVPITIAFIVAGISIFIVPKIKNIYADFGVDLPSLSFMFIKLTNWISEYWYLFLALPLLFLYAAAFIFFRESFRKSFGAALWPFPASRRKRSTLVLRAIDLAVRDSLPIEPALRALAAKHPYPARRRRLQKLCDAVERSSDVWEALAKRRLISLREVELFRAAENVGNLSWALHYSIERRDAKADRLVMIAAQLIGPIIVLCLGALVAFVCVGAFLPLVELISAMS